MRLVIQRVAHACVSVDGVTTGSCTNGLFILVGISDEDDAHTVEALWDKTKHLRIFEDEHHKMNRSLLDVGSSVLAISQFTLYANCRHGRRPSFVEAGAPAHAEELYNLFCACVEKDGVACGRGRFGADMTIEACCRGPVTICLDSERDLARAK